MQPAGKSPFLVYLLIPERLRASMVNIAAKRVLQAPARAEGKPLGSWALDVERWALNPAGETPAAVPGWISLQHKPRVQALDLLRVQNCLQQPGPPAGRPFAG